MGDIARITFDRAVMGGKSCIRGLRVTAGTIQGMMSCGYSEERMLAAHPYLEPEDLKAALTYAAWRVQESELPVAS